MKKNQPDQAHFKMQLRVRTQVRAGLLPDGDYKNSCTSIGYDPDSRILSASCPKTDGTWNSTTLTVPVTYGTDGFHNILNCNGVLTFGRSCNSVLDLPPS